LVNPYYSLLLDISFKVIKIYLREIIYIYSYNIGNKSLVIEDKWNWEERYPVLRISFAKDIKNKEDLKDKIYHELEKNYLKHSLKIPTKIKDNTLLFEKLIIKLNETKHKKIVILIDEYDKPILDLIEDIKKSSKC
jgi:hypothetical protein